MHGLINTSLGPEFIDQGCHKIFQAREPEDGRGKISCLESVVGALGAKGCSVLQSDSKMLEVVRNPLELPTTKDWDGILPEIAQHVSKQPVRLTASLNNPALYLAHNGDLDERPRNLRARARKLARAVGWQDSLGHTDRKKVASTLGLAAAPLIAMNALPGDAQAMDFDKTDAQIILINTGIHGLISGIGAKMHGKPFWEGFKYGALGGLEIGVAKYIASQNKNLALLSKVMTSHGSSISYNAARGRDPFGRFGIDLGPVFLQFERGKDQKFNMETFILPESLGVLAYNVVKGHKFQLGESLRYGTPVFQTDDYIFRHYEGTTLGTNVLLVKRGSSQKVLTEEFIHSLQYRQSEAVDPLLRGFMPVYSRLGDTLESRHVTPRLMIPTMIMYAPQHLLRYEDRPVEKESHRLLR